MEETTQRKTMKKQEKSEPKKQSILLKNQKRANQMMENEKKAKLEYTAKRIKEYVEFKMLKGHSEEEATKMAKEQIMNQAP
jgi:hypothetical protein|tara:strand:- start:3690 stop:3932 length:243 start_codon:yes stop_codon:yes gene_type:complete